MLTRRSALCATVALFAGAGTMVACSDLPLPKAERPGMQNAPIRRLRAGATFHGFWNYESDREMILALRTLRNAGGRWVRIDLGWAAVETARGVDSDWALEKYDHAIEVARSEDLKVLLVLQRTPGWANGSDDEALAPNDPSVFGDFALRMSQRYEGKVSAIELWNEPNHSSFFTARQEGQEAPEHAAMVEDAYRKIKEYGPQGDEALVVLAGGTSEVDIGWWERMYALGVADFTDVVAVNPYPVPADASITDISNGSSRIQEIDQLMDLMAGEGDSSKSIWVTELGWSTHRSEVGSKDTRLNVDDETQADRFEEVVRLVEKDYPQIEMLLWYNLRDLGGSGDGFETGFGLLGHDLEPKPVLRRMDELFVGN
ncbi:Cellulase (glycosyl hydrolase family 5) [Brevibacterium antiquum CNRZ 918]|uniref:Cellulase (Glycosyl hydrolase family 5) n=2 Tax=Brevibacteriaceae TaxID=85019 RepID=A0A2H1KZH3_9MICO|nr:Cellulase (glycosyl hydrolase family 5) [Brevibacterium antiquum CNRZ 918]